MEDQEIDFDDSKANRNKRKALICSYCHKRLSSKQCLREHIYIHTGEKPYVCTEPGCKKSYRQGSLLTIHRKVHEGILNLTSAFELKSAKALFPQFGKLVEKSEEIQDLRYNEKLQEMKSLIGKEEFEFIQKFLG